MPFEVTVTEETIATVEVSAGIPGPAGADGAPGVGVAPGGDTGQVLAKASGDDFDTEWVNQTGGPGAAEWGLITGTLSDQTDLQNALNDKLEASDIQFFETTTELNARDTANRNRANHVGLQALGTVAGAANRVVGTASDGSLQILNGWNLADVYGARGLSQFLGTTPEDEATQQFLRVNFFELGINPENNPQETFVANWAIDTNVDRTDTGGNFNRGITNIQARFTSEGSGNIGDMIGMNALVSGGVGSNTGSCQFITGIFSEAKTDSNYNAQGIVAGNFVSSVGLNSEIANNVNGVSIGVVLEDGAEVANVDGLFVNVNLGPDHADVNGFTACARIQGEGQVDGEISCLEVNAQNFVSNNSSVWAARFFGDVLISGNVNLSGGMSVGALNAFSSKEVFDTGGTPDSVHSFVSNVVAPENQTIANGDMIGANTACIIEVQSNAQVTSGPFSLGITALALPAVVSTASGSSIEHMHGAVFALNFDMSSTGGTVENAVGCRSVFIPNGVTQVDRSIGYLYDAPFGAISSDAWGIYVNADVENWFKQSVKIGGDSGSSDQVTNNTIALEVEGGAVLLPRLTTTERDALSAVDWMIVYNTTINTFQARASGTWIDLH
jgi:hypothetical protein